MNNTIDFNGTPLRLVPHEPDNGYRFYIADDGLIDGVMQGLRIAPNGVQTLVNASPKTTENSTDHYNAKRKQQYWHFANAFGYHKDILVHRAVYEAWSDTPIPPGHQIHHLTGITTDNRFDNLLCVSVEEHRKADARQKALRTLAPNGDLRLVPLDLMRELQDPRVTSNAAFDMALHSVVPAEQGKILPNCSPEPLRDV